MQEHQSLALFYRCLLTENICAFTWDRTLGSSNGEVITWKAIQPPYCIILLSWERISVTRLQDHFLNIWLFATMKNYPIAFKICQSRFNILPKTKETL